MIPVEQTREATNGAREGAFQHQLHAAEPPAPKLTVQSFGLTDRGRVRQTNEDQFVAASLMRALRVEQSSLVQSAMHYGEECGHLFVVADGMGGAAGGEQASALAVGALEEFMLNALRWLMALDGAVEATVLHDFREAIRNADACVYAAATSNPGLRGMGTTLTVAYSLGADLFVAHVGDSRCYLLRGDDLHQITHDHTLVQAMVESGVLQPENIAEHGLRHVITNVVGGPNPGVHVEIHRIRIEPGDSLLLCTDGLTGMVPDDRIKEALAGSAGLQQVCEHLARLANDAGGTDNITLIAARYE